MKCDFKTINIILYKKQRITVVKELYQRQIQ